MFFLFGGGSSSQKGRTAARMPAVAVPLAAALSNLRPRSRFGEGSECELLVFVVYRMVCSW